MTIQEITWLIKLLGTYGSGTILGGLILYFIIQKHLTGYLNEKGKNLATKEDIEQITHLVKGVEHQYNVLIKQMEATQQLRMAAMDERLKAHQQAFTLWVKVRSSVAYRNKIIPAVNECKQWYNENCLYLEPDVREAFVNAFSQVLHSSVLIDEGAPEEEKIESWAVVEAFPDILFKAAQLPGISSAEIAAATEQITRTEGA